MMKRLLALVLVLIAAVAFGSSLAAQDAEDTIVIGITSDVQGFNTFAETSVTNLVTSFMWPTLVQSDPQTGQVIPNLAIWTISEDGLTYTFAIDPNANWSDGTPITANDAKFMLESSQSPVVGSFLAGQYTWEALNVIDDKTLEVVLPQVDCTFLSNLTWGVMPSQRFAADFSDYNTAAINTAPDVSGGPYIFAEHSPDEFIRLTANPTYWKGAPHIENIVFQIVPDSEVMFQALMSGDVDIAFISADQDLAAASNPNITVFRYPANGVYFTAFNLADPVNAQPAYDAEGNLVEQGSHPVFGDVAVRRAYAMGYDHDAVAALAGEGAARSIGAIPPVVSWAYASAIPPMPYDPEGAAALLEEAGWVDSDGDGVREKDGVPLEFQLDYPAGDSVIEGAVLIIQDQLGQIGFRVNLNGAEQQSLLGSRLLVQNYDAFYLVIGAANAEPDFNPNLLLNSRQDVPGGGLNFSSYVNPELDELLAAGRTVPGCAVEDRAPIYEEVQQITVDDVPYDFTYSPSTRFAYNNRIENINLGPWSLYGNVHEWTIGE